MKRLKIAAKTILTAILIFSFALLMACDGGQKAADGLYAASFADENGQRTDKGQDSNGLSAKEQAAEDFSGNAADNKAYPADPNDYTGLRELIKEAIDNSKAGSVEFNGVSYTITEVDGGDLSGKREALAAVDIGFGDREYWSFTNEFRQLIYVYADRIIPQDEENEPVTSDGRYYNDEAKVDGSQRKDLDEGHVIADSLGGVSNAYNISPQNSSLNRYGDQAYMEKVIRDAGGCEKFFAVITYQDTDSQIPSHYHYEYIINGDNIVEDFDNTDPDEINKSFIQEDKKGQAGKEAKKSKNQAEEHDLSAVDKNGDGRVTIAEAKAAGYRMPIYSDHWLYPYMEDRDGDGMVGE